MITETACAAPGARSRQRRRRAVLAAHVNIRGHRGESPPPSTRNNRRWEFQSLRRGLQAAVRNRDVLDAGVRRLDKNRVQKEALEARDGAEAADARFDTVTASACPRKSPPAPAEELALAAADPGGNGGTARPLIGPSPSASTRAGRESPAATEPAGHGEPSDDQRPWAPPERRRKNGPRTARARRFGLRREWSRSRPCPASSGCRGRLLSHRRHRVMRETPARVARPTWSSSPAARNRGTCQRRSST